MKLIISMQDGSVNMISVNRIGSIVFTAESIFVIDDISGTETFYSYKDIRSLVIA